MNKSENLPLVSVIICVYNGEKYIAEAMESILSENYPRIEIICLDDGSTDSTINILKKFGAAVKISSQENKGVAIARNQANKIAQGELITYLDSDDLFVQGRIAKMVEVFSQKPKTAIVFGQIKQFITPELASSTLEKIKLKEEILTGVCPGGIMYRSDIFKQIGEFEEGNHTAYFLDWYLKAKEQKLIEEYLEQVVTLRRIHPNNSGLIQKENFSAEAPKAIKAHLDRLRAGREK